MLYVYIPFLNSISFRKNDPCLSLCVYLVCVSMSVCVCLNLSVCYSCLCVSEYVCVTMCKCMYLSAYLCLCISLYVCFFAYSSVCVCIFVSFSLCVYLYVRVFVCMPASLSPCVLCACVYVSLCVSMCFFSMSVFELKFISVTVKLSQRQRS